MWQPERRKQRAFFKLTHDTFIVLRRELRREHAWSRIYLYPALQAEADRDEYRRTRAALEREKEVMKDNPDWEVGKSVYNTKRYVRQLISFDHTKI